CEADAALDHILPADRAERLVLPERGIVHRDRARDETAVDMALEAPAEGLKPELATIGALGAQVEAGDPEPARDDVLGPVARLEDAQRARRELLALVLRHREEVVLDLAQAIAAETRGADIGPRTLGAVARGQRRVDGGRHGFGDGRTWRAGAVEET